MHVNQSSVILGELGSLYIFSAYLFLKRFCVLQYNIKYPYEMLITYTQLYNNFNFKVGWWVGFYGISTIVGYLASSKYS